MYRHCIFCHSDLGRNELIEHLPIGRRIAFDSTRGRLWVICRKCTRWNLCPIEERWEAVEECERCFRGTILRSSTEHIGLACLSHHLDLVRIGRMLRPEFAAWRYGDRFGRRRRIYLGHAAVTATVVGTVVAAPWVGLTSMIAFPIFPLYFLYTARMSRANSRILHVIPTLGDVLYVPPGGVNKLAFRSRDDREDDAWQLEVLHNHGTATLEGREAVHALAILMTGLNSAGGSARHVRAAVSEIESVGDPNRYISVAQKHACRSTGEPLPIASFPREVRLALEMAANEEVERRALEGELYMLEQAWREAEAVAAVADDLLIPAGVRRAMRRLRPNA